MNLTLDVQLKLASAIVSTLFAALVLSAGTRERENRLLAAFLALLTLNFACDTMMSLTDDPVTALAWKHVAVLPTLLDPIVLLLFYMESFDRVRAAPILVGLAAGAGIGAWSAFYDLHGTLASQPFELARVAFTLTYYALCARLALRAVAREPALEAPALALAAILVPLVANAGNTGYAILADLQLAGVAVPPVGLLDPPGFGRFVAPLLVILALAFAAARHAVPTRRLARLLVPALVVHYAIEITSVAWLLRAATVALALQRPMSVLAHAAGPLRWFVFTALVSFALLRHDMLGMSLRMRRVAARVLVAIAFLGASFLALGSYESISGDALRASDLALIGLVVLSTQGSRTLMDRVAASAYRVPLPRDRAAAMERYREAAAQAQLAGSRDEDRARLLRLREELALTDEEALVVERLVEARDAGPLSAGQLVAGRYRIERLLGRGGAGRALLAFDTLLHRRVVIKEVLVADDATRDAALTEARTAGQLQHPNVVALYDLLQRDGAWLLVSEHVERGSLAEQLGASGPLDTRQTLRLADDLLAALEAVHARGIVHRDVKPSNVLLSSSDEAKLGDFGVARAQRGVTARFDEPDALLGTPEFMAPEQRAGLRATPRTDLYAVGLVMRAAHPTPFPPRVDAVVARALAQDPAARHASASEMRRALAAAAALEAR